MRAMNATLNRKKSTSSAAASISAWCAVLDWPSIVAASTVSRQGPASSSAARRKTAARSSHGHRDHSCHAAAAASTACATCSAEPWCTSASTCSLSCGITAGFVVPVWTRRPPITSGTSMRVACISASRARRLARSGLPGAYSRTGSFRAAGGRNLACELTPGKVRGRDEDPDHESERRGPEGGADERPIGRGLADAEEEHRHAAGDPEPPDDRPDLAGPERRERRADDHGRAAGSRRRDELGGAGPERGRLDREQRRAAQHDDAGEEAVGVVAQDPRVQTAEEPQERERRRREQRDRQALVVRTEREREHSQRDVDEAEQGCVRAQEWAARYHGATLQHPAMSLSDELRDELAAIAPRRRCCRLSELSALFHAAGTWHLRGHGSRSLHLDVASAAAARRAFALLRDVGVRSELRTYRRRAFDRATRYQLHVELDRAAAQLLREAGIVGRGGEPLERPPRRVTGRSCCRAAYLRGALLGGSSLSGPRSPHLELRASGRAGAEFVAGVAARDGLPLRVLDRRAGAIAYAKGSETIADLVALAGASETALRFDEHAVVAATRADANRLANADEANVVRTTRAAHAQLQAIRALEGEPLPRKLQEIDRKSVV